MLILPKQSLSQASVKYEKQLIYCKRALRLTLDQLNSYEELNHDFMPVSDHQIKLIVDGGQLQRDSLELEEDDTEEEINKLVSKSLRLLLNN